MEGASSAVSIVSIGIQVCQGLLSYYHSWKGYKSDIATAYHRVDDLRQTFELLQGTLRWQELDSARVKRVEECLGLCANSLSDLQNTLKEIQTYPFPSGLQEKLRSGFQRLSYPFKESTLAKICKIGSELREHLSLALQDLQLNLSVNSHRNLIQIGANVRDLLTTQQTDQFHKLVDWLSPPNPWTSHKEARKLHVPHTGSWFLQSEQYQRWKGGHTPCLWLYGKAGCGKTVLSSTVIEDLQLHCESAANVALAVFYFSFSDDGRQTFENLLLSLVAQLGWKEPGRSMLQREHDKPNRSLLGPVVVEEILVSLISQYDEVFLALDALDECPESEEARQNMLEGLERIFRRAPTLKVLATSREQREIRDRMYALGADVIPVSTRPVDADIRKYVERELSRDHNLRSLEEDLKDLIMKTFAEKADGMFRWARCQLQELKKLKSFAPKYVKKALTQLPPTLDKTYERMLSEIGDMYFDEALRFIQWLAFQRRPLTLAELAEAGVIDPSGNGTVDFKNRSRPEEVLEMLSGLVELYDSNHEALWNSPASIPIPTNEEDPPITLPAPRIDGSSRVRLAHYSVKEYLVSTIPQGEAKKFQLHEGREHRHIAQSCLAYILECSSQNGNLNEQDLEHFPLLEYAAKSWYYHSSFQDRLDPGHEVYLLDSDKAKRDWLTIHQPDKSWGPPFRELSDVGSSLYYAALLGLSSTVEHFLVDGADVNAQGGNYGNALQAASYEGYEKVVSMLLVGGADINAQGGYYGNALQAASYKGYEKFVSKLLDRGANVNAQGGSFGTALQAASSCGYKRTMLTARKGKYNKAQQVALGGSYEKVVEILLDRGAEINAQGGYFGNALQAASFMGYEKVVSILLDQGANVNAQGGEYSYALQAASCEGHEKVISMLLVRGANVNAQGGRYDNALQAASLRGHEKVVSILIGKGAHRLSLDDLQLSD